MKSFLSVVSIITSLSISFFSFTSCSPVDKPLTGKTVDEKAKTNQSSVNAPPEDFRNALFNVKSSLNDLNLLNLIPDETTTFSQQKNWKISKSETVSVVNSESESYKLLAVEYSVESMSSSSPKVAVEGQSPKSESIYLDSQHFKISENNMSWKLQFLRDKSGAFSKLQITNEGGVVKVENKGSDEIKTHSLTSDFKKIEVSIKDNKIFVQSKFIFNTSDKVLNENTNTLKSNLVLANSTNIDVNQISSLADLKKIISSAKVDSLSSSLLRQGQSDYTIFYVMKTDKLVMQQSNNCWNFSGVVSFNYSKDRQRQIDEPNLRFTDLKVSPNQASIVVSNKGSKNEIIYNHITCEELDGAMDTSILLQN